MVLSTSLKWVWAIRSGDLTGELGRVGAADQQVTGVQAQRHRRALEDPLDLVAGLDHGADVRVQHGAARRARLHGRRCGRGFAAAAPSRRRRVPGGCHIRRARRPPTAPAFWRRSRRSRRGCGRSPAAGRSGRCISTGVKPPTAVRWWVSSTLAIWSGSAGRKPSGPSSVADRPMSCISASTRSGVSW